jgi:ATP/maltotriose-dependent transcriptional regulator MalT
VNTASDITRGFMSVTKSARRAAKRDHEGNGRRETGTAPPQRRADELCAIPCAGGHRSDPLTARERDVLAMISQGLSNKRIARALEISTETVKSHVKHIFLKLEVSTRTEAVFSGAVA